MREASLFVILSLDGFFRDLHAVWYRAESDILRGIHDDD